MTRFLKSFEMLKTAQAFLNLISVFHYTVFLVVGVFLLNPTYLRLLGVFGNNVAIKRQCGKKEGFLRTTRGFWSISMYSMKTKAFGGVWGIKNGKICRRFFHFIFLVF